MKPLPRQFRPRHRRPTVITRTGTVSVAVLSVTLLSTVPADTPAAMFAGSAYAGSEVVASSARPWPASPSGAAASPSGAALSGAALSGAALSGAALSSASPSGAVTSGVPAPVGPDGVQALLVPAAPPVAPAAPGVRPVAGLDQRQMDNAARIVRQGKAQGMPDRALIVAIATAMQESDLYNVASSAVPSSLTLPHEGISADHDSVGLFQQRSSQGWGTVADLMNPTHSAMLFYAALSRVQGWERLSVAAAAQAVQRSAFPGAYQKHATRAEQVVGALT